jgi:hypothetical protein
MPALDLALGLRVIRGAADMLGEPNDFHPLSAASRPPCS